MTFRETATTPTVERSIDLDADVEAVWATLTDPDGLEDWLGERATLDLQPGGGGTVIDDVGVSRDVLVVAVEPGRRLAWHWWSDEGELSTVDITVHPRHDGGCRVAVVETLAGEPLVGDGLLGDPALDAAGDDPGWAGGGFRAEACAAGSRLAVLAGRRGLVSAAAPAGTGRLQGVAR